MECLVERVFRRKPFSGKRREKRALRRKQIPLRIVFVFLPLLPDVPERFLERNFFLYEDRVQFHHDEWEMEILSMFQTEQKVEVFDFFLFPEFVRGDDEIKDAFEFDVDAV